MNGQSKRTRRAAVLLLAGLVVACGAPALESSNTTTRLPTTNTGQSGFVDNSGRDAMGAWDHVPSSTLVVRGRLTAIVDEFQYSNVYDVWALEVSQFLIGEADTTTLQVGHYSPRNPPASSHNRDGHDPDSRTPWSVGDEGIFFLTTWFHPLPELYVPVLGSIGIVTEDLDYWSQHLPRAARAIGPSAWSDPLPDDDFARAVQTEYIVDGMVTEVSAPLQQLGSSYIEVTLDGTDVVWSAWHDAEGQPGPEGEPEDPPSRLRLVFSAEDTGIPEVGSTIRVMIGIKPVPEPEWHVWMAIGGSTGLVDIHTTREALRHEMERHRKEENREARRSDRWATITAVLTPLTAEFGRIPLRSDREPEPVPLTDDELRDLMRSPLEVVQGDIRIVFSLWPFTLMDGTGRVQILDTAGVELLEGPFEGPDSVLREPEGMFEFISPDGTVVASLAGDDLTHAQNEAYADAVKAKNQR